MKRLNGAKASTSANAAETLIAPAQRMSIPKSGAGYGSRLHDAGRHATLDETALGAALFECAGHVC